jgi:hypothetical protein
MNRNAVAGLVTAAIVISSVSLAQDREPAVPPQNAMKLSQIVATVEQRSDFRYVSEVAWNEDGYYDVIYYTGDKAKVEVKIDAVTGKTR